MGNLDRIKFRLKRFLKLVSIDFQLKLNSKFQVNFWEFSKCDNENWIKFSRRDYWVSYKIATFTFKVFRCFLSIITFAVARNFKLVQVIYTHK